MAEKGSGATGHYTADIVVTNTGSSTCTLSGYPGVSFVYGDHGAQLGAAATRVSGDAVAIQLTPGAHAYAPVEITEAENVSCTRHQAEGFRVYLPNEKNADFARFSASGCEQSSQKLLRIGPFRR